MALSKELTPFQVSCEAAVSDALRRVHRRLVDRSIAGEREAFVKVRVDGTNVWLYFYEDEAGIAGRGTLETQHYGSSDELQGAFVQWVLTVLETENAI